MPRSKWTWFFNLDYKAWLCGNIEEKDEITRLVDMDWLLLFFAAIWTIWKARNDLCFNNVHFSTFGVVKQAKIFARDMQLKEDSFYKFHLDPMNGRWFYPPPGYVKLNVDGSVRDGQATFDGLLGDHEVSWMWGFVGSCWFSSPLYAKLMAM